MVDDASNDRTREIGEGFEGFEGVKVLQAPPLDLAETRVFTGKTNACWFGAQTARGAVFAVYGCGYVASTGGFGAGVRGDPGAKCGAFVVFAAAGGVGFLAEGVDAAGVFGAR